MEVLQSRRKLILGIAGAVVLAAIIWVIVTVSNPYYGLETERGNSVDQATQNIVAQRLELSLSALEAQKASGDEVDLDIYNAIIFDAWTLGDLVLAREMSEEYLELNSINYGAWNFYGVVLEQMGDLEAAEEAYAHAIGFNEGVEEYYRDYIELIEQDPERKEDVRAALENLIANAGQSAWNMVKLGEWYYENGECDDAIAHYEIATELSPENEAIQTDLDGLRVECSR